MMWRLTLICFSYVVAQVASRETNVECLEYNGKKVEETSGRATKEGSLSQDGQTCNDVTCFPPYSNTTPSVLAHLKAELVTVEGKTKINISWAVNIDSSIEYLMGTRISADSVYHCEYNPPLAKTNLTGSEEKWFHFLVSARIGFNKIEVANIPFSLDESALHYKYTIIEVSLPTQSTQRPIQGPTVESTTITEIPTEKPKTPSISIAMAIFGGLVGLMILSFCIVLYKSCGTNLTTSLGFKRLPTSPMVPLVSVLVVYPAENLAFQRAVVALAEFLQWHAGCKVAIDMWQQGKIAELGPMRWLAEQAKAVERVLIVYPQPSSQPSHSPSKNSSPGPSIPAAAHDLYPLILNMVASHAKSAIDLAQFWVVQLGKQQDRSSSNLPLELRGCKTFCLMKDLKKLCRSLYTQRKDDKKKTSDLTFRPGIAYIEKSTVNLREAVEKLGGDQSSISREAKPLKSDCFCLNTCHENV